MYTPEQYNDDDLLNIILILLLYFLEIFWSIRTVDPVCDLGDPVVIFASQQISMKLRNGYPVVRIDLGEYYQDTILPRMRQSFVFRDDAELVLEKQNVVMGRCMET